jgi:hypothetical protein
MRADDEDWVRDQITNAVEDAMKTHKDDVWAHIKAKYQGMYGPEVTWIQRVADEVRDHEEKQRDLAEGRCHCCRALLPDDKITDQQRQHRLRQLELELETVPEEPPTDAKRKS